MAITRMSNPDMGGRLYFAVRPGYASTIIKFQGAELRHVTAYLDVPGVPGAALESSAGVPPPWHTELGIIKHDMLQMERTHDDCETCTTSVSDSMG